METLSSQPCFKTHGQSKRYFPFERRSWGKKRRNECIPSHGNPIRTLSRDGSRISAGMVFFCIYCVMSSLCYAASGQVIEVREGDLLMISSEGVMQKVRLYGVMCPVKGQPFHEDARLLANYLARQKNVDITTVFRDAEGVSHAMLRIDGTKYFLNERLIGHGMAWVKPSECRATLCEEWRKLEGLARKNAVGLWAVPSPIPPWEWEKEKRMEIYRRSLKGSGIAE